MEYAIVGSVLSLLISMKFTDFKSKEAEERPLPSDETTPPVTNMYRAMEVCYNRLFVKNKVYFEDSGICGRFKF